jgi:serine/threonine protein kinase
LDIKLDNFLIGDDDCIKLTDFEFSAQGHTAILCRRFFVGTNGFQPPEILLKRPYNAFKADIFSLGVTLFLL